MGFSEESISRSPAADLDGGTFFRVGDSFASRAATLFFRFPGGGSTLTAPSRELCGSVCWLNSGRRVTAGDVWPVIIIAAPLVQFSGLVIGSHCPKTAKRLLIHIQLLAIRKTRTPRRKTRSSTWTLTFLGNAIQDKTARWVGVDSKRRGPLFAG